MDQRKYWRRTLQYQPETWRTDDPGSSREQEQFTGSAQHLRSEPHPDVRDQTRVLELLGRINYKIIKGKRVYVEVGGVVYKTLYGGYWRSVFTGDEHYLLRCEQVSGSVWADENCATAVDLPIAYSHRGWTASGYSLSFMLARD